MKNHNFKKMLLMLSVMSSPFVVADVIDANIASANEVATKSGWEKDTKGNWYYFHKGQKVVNSWIGEYYVDATGKWVKGAVKPQPKKEEVKNGWVKTNQGQWYYYDKGRVVVNRWIGNYYLGANGVMLTNAWTPDGYYVDANGKWVKGAVKPQPKKEEVKQGWYKGTSGSWYYYDKGRLAVNSWVGNYYLGSNGAMLTNTWTPDGYYVDANGKWVKGAVKPESKKEEVKNGWVKTNQGNWYYYEKGRMVVNRWIGNYYLGSNGIMLTSTWTPDGYYVDGNGKWVKGAVKPESKKEEVKNGWVKTNQGNWYYYEKGRMVVNRWIGNYYLGSNGIMLTSTWTPDGYYVDENGKWVKDYVKPTSNSTFSNTGASASQGNYKAINNVVYLDAGHGGRDPGAVYNGVTEKELNLSVQNKVKANLEKAGYRVVTTRTNDSSMELMDRSKKANASDSDLFVSIHFNASTNKLKEGIETYWYQPYAEYPARINKHHTNEERLARSKYLAEAIHRDVVTSTGATDSGVQRNTFSVLRETTAPSVLLELGYMSNPSENATIRRDDYQKKLADAITRGIMKYYKYFS